MIQFTNSNDVEYKIALYQETALSSLIFGSSKVDPIRFSKFLNELAKEGWRVVTMEKDIRRLFLFWNREAFLVVLIRNKK